MNRVWISTIKQVYLNKFNGLVEDVLLRKGGGSGMFPLHLDLLPLNNNNSAAESNDNDVLKDDGFTWYCPTPKKRTTAEKKLTKKFMPLNNNQITKQARAKTNIVACLDCGLYHEIGTICGNCYQRIRKETMLIQDQLMNNEKFRYNGEAPLDRELKISYEDDASRQQQEQEVDGQNRLVVEMPKKRPSWFNQNLFGSKINTK